MKPAIRTVFVLVACGVAIFFTQPTVQAAGANNVLEALQQAPVDPCNWGGFYIGVSIGGSFNHFDASKQATDVDLGQQFNELVNKGIEGGGEPIAGSFITTFHTDGHHDRDTETIGGGQTGFNLQFGHFVVGAEGSFIGNASKTSQGSQQFQTNEFFIFEEVPITADTKFTSWRMVETTWNGFAGGRVGFCWNRFLFYGTGGAAFTDAHFFSMEKADTSFFGFFGDGGSPTHQVARGVGPRQQEPFIGEIVSTSKHGRGDILTGWYAGGGTMYQLTNLVSAGFEYRHVGYGDQGENLMNANGPVFPGNGRVDVSSDQVLFKVNFIVGPGLFGH
jgi:opacity protein-like surface antigen